VSSPRLSVCIPTFERVAYLREAVGSAQAQSVQELEILVGDDGNSAELREYVEATARVDPRVRYLKTPERLRLARNWTFLAHQARGEFATFMGDDDRLLPRFAERLLEAASSDVAVAFSNHFLIDARGVRLAEESELTTRQYRRDEISPGILPDARVAVWRNSVPMSSAIVRTVHVQRLEFKPDINTPEIELFARLSGESARFAFVPEYLCEYRTHAASETTSGLTLDRLAEYLVDIPVPPSLEHEKRAYVERLVLAGVSIRLRRGDLDGARRLRSLAYYPRRGALHARAVQRLCLAMPDRLATNAFRALTRLGQEARRALLNGAAR
jgi:glycosyltransferase involved in cell wall biosynthesis